MEDEQAFAGKDEPGHPHQLENTTPEMLIRMIYSAAEILEKYGWFIVLGIILTIFIIEKLRPFFQKWKNQMEDYSSKKTDDPNRIYQQHESMGNSRRKLQEKIDLEAERAKERKQQLEAEKRREKIEDWERHQLGQGYRSKVKKPQGEPAAQDAKRPKSKRQMRPSDYNPLMGPGGGSGYRPSPRGGQFGGG